MPEPAGGAEQRLVTYGSLSPGELNHHELASLTGRWQPATIRGTRIDAGWGAGLGFPGLILDPLGPVLEVHLFESPDLPAHWSRLDEFEGPGYQRVVTTVQTLEGDRTAYVYALATASQP